MEPDRARTEPLRRRWQPLGDFLLGASIAGVAAAVFLNAYPGFWSPPAQHDAGMVPERGHAMHVEARANEATPTAEVGSAASAGRCDFDPIVPPASAADGHVVAEHPFPAGPRAKAKVFVRAAEAAAARHRPRDAEVAWIAACRYSELAGKTPNVPLARVLGRLGEHYTSVASAAESPALREQLATRARHLLEISAQAYATALGPNAARSRQAQKLLAGFDERLAAAGEAGEPAALLAPRSDERIAKANTRHLRGPTPTTRSLSPSQEPPAATVPAAPPASDAQIRQLASNLARLQAQAEAVSDDPAGMRRRTQAALAQRDECHDRACLLGWYSRRRSQLLAEF